MNTMLCVIKGFQVHHYLSLLSTGIELFMAFHIILTLGVGFPAALPHCYALGHIPRWMIVMNITPGVYNTLCEYKVASTTRLPFPSLIWHRAGVRLQGCARDDSSILHCFLRSKWTLVVWTLTMTSLVSVTFSTESVDKRPFIYQSIPVWGAYHDNQNISCEGQCWQKRHFINKSIPV